MAQRPTKLPAVEVVEQIRALFLEMGGDLDHPEAIPDGMWAVVAAHQMKCYGARNTRWPTFLTPAYDTHIDEIAVMRAVEGDVQVMENLTHYENQVFLDRLWAKTPTWQADARVETVGRKMTQGESPEPHIGVLRFGGRWGSLLKTMQKRHQRALAA